MNLLVREAQSTTSSFPYRNGYIPAKFSSFSTPLSLSRPLFLFPFLFVLVCTLDLSLNAQLLLVRVKCMIFYRGNVQKNVPFFDRSIQV